MKFEKQDIFIVLFFLLIFSTFIFNSIGQAPFWLDEAATANLLPLGYGEIISKAITDAHPLFYILLLKTWSIFFGQSELALRAFSAICAMALLCMVYIFCRKWFDKKIATIALALITTSYFLIWYANENRPYTLIPLLSLVSYYFFLEIIENPKKKQIILYILITVCGLYTHPWFYFVFGSQILSVLLWQRDNIKLLIYQLYILLLAIPSVYIIFLQRNMGVSSWLTKPVLNDLVNSLNLYSSNHIWLYILISLTALFIALYNEESCRITNIRTKMLCIYFFVPFILAFTISQYTSLYVTGRYEMILLPAFIILIAILWSKIDSYILFFIFIILFGLTTKLVFNKHQYTSSLASSDKTITADIMARAQKNDAIITTDLSWSTIYYYVSRSPIQKNISLQSFPKEIESHPGWKNIQEMNSKKELYEKEALELIKKIKDDENVQQIWVFYNSNNEIDSILKKALEQEFELTETISPKLPRQSSWFDLVYLFRK